MRNHMKRLLLVAASFAATTLPVSAQEGSWNGAPQPVTRLAQFDVDTVHSELSFRIRHLFGRVAGTFGNWEGTVAMDTLDIGNTKVDVTIQTASIDTRVKQRDDHLRTSDFFAADSFPTITFRSTKVETAGNLFRVHGDLTIRGRTRPAVLEGTYIGLFDDPWGGRRIAFTASTVINRQDYGVSFNGPFEQIGQIGDDVTIDIAVEAVRR